MKIMGNEIQFLLYNVPEGDGKVQVIVKDETLWMTQKAMGMLFDVERSVITKHLNNIFKSDELQKDSVCAKIAHTADDGKKYQTNFYNLDAIISRRISRNRRERIASLALVGFAERFHPDGTRKR